MTTTTTTTAWMRSKPLYRKTEQTASSLLFLQDLQGAAAPVETFADAKEIFEKLVRWDALPQVVVRWVDGAFVLETKGVRTLVDVLTGRIPAWLDLDNGTIVDVEPASNAYPAVCAVDVLMARRVAGKLTGDKDGPAELRAVMAAIDSGPTFSVLILG